MFPLCVSYKKTANVNSMTSRDEDCFVHLGLPNPQETLPLYVIISGRRSL